MIFELSTDSLFHDRVARFDTRVDTDFAPSDGELSFTGMDSLEAVSYTHLTLPTILLV